MSYAVTFKDYQPSDRSDGAPWTHARIDEAAQQAGPFITIDTLDLSPVDANPAEPAARSFTTEKATMASGWYQVVLLDDSGAQEVFDAVYSTAVGSGFVPGVGDVAAHLWARTRDGLGNEVGTFTSQTRPTRDQVERLIERAASKVTSKIGTDIPAALWEKARTQIALRAAAFVELSFFPDQITAGRSPYAELKKEADQEWAELYSDWQDLGPDGIPGTGDDTGDGGLPVFSFPTLGGCRAPGAENPYDCNRRDW